MRACLLTLLVASACGGSPLGPDLQERFELFGGCADVVFYAVDADDEVQLTFFAEGLVTAAREADSETTTVFDLPAVDVSLIVEQGSHVSDATCDDVIEFPGPSVRRTWTATSGTATVRIRPGTDGARGDLVLEDVTFSATGDDDLVLDRLEWQDVSVGWFAG
jgi:hypothetical protein